MDDFIDCFAALPNHVQERARRCYRLWCENPNHPSLRFKRVHASEPVYSVRIGLEWRALGLLEGDSIYWFWIGSHSEYDQLLRRL